MRDDAVAHGAEGGEHDHGANRHGAPGQPPVVTPHHHVGQRDEGHRDEEARQPHELVHHEHHPLLGSPLHDDQRGLHDHHRERDEEGQGVEDQEDYEGRVARHVRLPQGHAGRRLGQILHEVSGDREYGGKGDCGDKHSNDGVGVDGVVQPANVELFEPLLDLIDLHLGLTCLLDLGLDIMSNITDCLLQLLRGIRRMYLLFCSFSTSLF